MNKNKAFVDTTILTDRLLKPSGKGIVAKEALEAYAKTELPVYAIKEFKSGPLSKFVWLHNKLVTTKSFFDTLASLRSVWRQQYRVSTALEAIEEAAENIKQLIPKDLEDKYGAKASIDVSLCDSFRDSIEVAVLTAWKRRRKVTTEVVEPLSCYEEKEPFEKRGLLKLEPTRCKPIKECCLAPKLREKIEELNLLQEVIKELPESRENKGRYRALHEISRKPKQLVSEEMCRALGDAYFALFCPQDSVILTTNEKDHKPLAESLGKTVETPINDKQ